MVTQWSGYRSQSTASTVHAKLPTHIFMVLGMPYLVYIREARDDEVHFDEQLLLEQNDVNQESTEKIDAKDNKRFIIFAANGECLAVVPNRKMAMAWAQENNLTPQSVH